MARVHEDDWPGSSGFREEERNTQGQEELNDQIETLDTNYYAVLGLSRTVCSLTA